MPNAQTFNRTAYEAGESGFDNIPDPGLNGTFVLAGKSCIRCTVDAAGNAGGYRVLPTPKFVGQRLIVSAWDSTGGSEDVLIKKPDGSTTLATVSVGEVCELISSHHQATAGSFIWTGHILATGSVT